MPIKNNTSATINASPTDAAPTTIEMTANAIKTRAIQCAFLPNKAYVMCPPSSCPTGIIFKPVISSPTQPAM